MFTIFRGMENTTSAKEKLKLKQATCIIAQSYTK